MGLAGHAPTCALLLTLAAAGCGDDSGGGVADATTPGGDADGAAAFQVRLVDPADGAIEVANDVGVLVSFNRPIDPTTVTGASFVLEDGDGAAVPSSITLGATDAQITPDAPLAINTTYTARVTTAVTDTDGNALASDYAWSFATHRQAWGTAALLETFDGFSARAPAVAMTPATNEALAVWRQPAAGGIDSIWASTYDPAGGWTTPILLEADEAGDAQRPQVGMDYAGNGFAVWEQFDGTYSNIWVARYSRAIGWRAAQPLDVQDAGDATKPSLHVSSTGDAIVVWQQVDGGTTNVWARNYSAVAGDWQAPVLLDTAAGPASTPRVAGDGGFAVAVWLQAGTMSTDVWSSAYFNNSWNVPQRVAENAAASEAHVAMSGGSAVAWWLQPGVAGADLWARFSQGSSWLPVEQLDNGAGSVSHPRAVVDGAGNAVVVWEQHDGSIDNLWTNRLVAGGDWSGPMLLEQQDIGTAGFPSMCVDGANTIFVVWNQWDGVRNDIYARRWTEGAGWNSTKIIDSDDAPFATDASVTCDNNGNAIAAWSQGIPSSIWHNRFE